jgi:hypothetical protein
MNLFCHKYGVKVKAEAKLFFFIGSETNEKITKFAKKNGNEKSTALQAI